MNCTATTRLTAEECLARLAACPALPRGGRMFAPGWEPIRYSRKHSVLWVALLRRFSLAAVLDMPAAGPIAAGKSAIEWWERKAAPVRRLREERRALRARVRELERAVLRYGPVHQCWCGSTVIHHECNECGVTLDDKTTLGAEP